ncbi:MAG: histidine phosphatase family protein [Actinomycetota bacterium]
MELLLIRHGLPTRVDHADGPADPGLADLGHRQAEALAQWLVHERVNALYSSPLRRARETAAPASRALGLDVVVDEELAEFDRGATFYVPVEDMRAENDPRLADLLAGRWGADGNLDVTSFRATVVAAIERIVAGNAGGTVAVVAHGGVINAYVADVLATPSVMVFEPGYTSVSRVLAARSGERNVVSLNETAHLDRRSRNGRRTA